MKNNRVLVTGASGFVGKHLCRSLLSKGFWVRGTYRSSLPVEPELESVEWVLVPTIGIDTDWNHLLKDINYVIHLAAMAHKVGIDGRNRFEEFMNVNGAGTKKLTEAVKLSLTVKRFMYLSSMSVISSYSNYPINSATPCKPVTNYAKSKLAGETAVRATLSKGDPDWCIIRAPLVYGPGNPGSLARLLNLLDLGIPLPLAGFSNERTLIFVGNLVDAMFRCLLYPQCSRQILLVGDLETVSTAQLVKYLARAKDVSIRLFPIPLFIYWLLGKVGDFSEAKFGKSIGFNSYSVSGLVKHLIVDTTYTQDIVDWKPPYTLQQGLEYTVQDNHRFIFKEASSHLGDQ